MALYNTWPSLLIDIPSSQSSKVSNSFEEMRVYNIRFGVGGFKKKTLDKFRGSNGLFSLLENTSICNLLENHNVNKK